MRNQSRYDIGAIGGQVLSGGRLTFSQRGAGFSVLASDVDEAAAVAAVWLVQAGRRDSVEYAIQFERIGSWRCLGWSGGSARNLPLTGRLSAADAPTRAIELLTSGASRSRLDGEWQAAGGGGDGTGWVGSVRGIPSRC